MGCTQVARDDLITKDHDAQHPLESPPSPIKRPHHPTTPSQHSEPTHFLPLLPPVSPIRASPHRKHVRFHGTGGSDKSTRSSEAVRLARESGADANTVVRRALPAKQPVWDHKNTSPPRVRNRFFAASKARKFTVLTDDDSGDGDVDETLNLFKVPTCALQSSLLSRSRSLSANTVVQSSSSPLGPCWFQTQFEAPRRSLLPVSSSYEDL